METKDVLKFRIQINSFMQSERKIVGKPAPKREFSKPFARSTSADFTEVNVRVKIRNSHKQKQRKTPKEGSSQHSKEQYPSQLLQPARHRFAFHSSQKRGLFTYFQS